MKKIFSLMAIMFAAFAFVSCKGGKTDSAEKFVRVADGHFSAAAGFAVVGGDCAIHQDVTFMTFTASGRSRNPSRCSTPI